MRNYGSAFLEQKVPYDFNSSSTIRSLTFSHLHYNIQKTCPFCGSSLESDFLKDDIKAKPISETFFEHLLKPMSKNFFENVYYCHYCGIMLTMEESSSHSCKNSRSNNFLIL